MEILISAGASMDLADRDGNSPLLRAAENGHVAVVKLLVDNGSADFRNKAGYTPIMLSSQNGHDDVVVVLLQKEVNNFRTAMERSN